MRASRIVKRLVKWLVPIAAIVFATTSCKSVANAPSVSRIDTTYIEKVTHDSIFQSDSVFIEKRGDTIYLNRLRYVFIRTTISDKKEHERTDTITVTREVEAKLNKWQMLKMSVGGYAIGAVALFLCFPVLWRILKK